MEDSSPASPPRTVIPASLGLVDRPFDPLLVAGVETTVDMSDHDRARTAR